MINHVRSGIFVVLLACSSAFGQTDDVTTKSVKLSLKNVSVQRVLIELSIESGVSIGFERSDLDDSQTSLSVDESQRTVRDVLNHIVKQVPLYKWKTHDGIIILMPVRGRSPILETFLNIQVREFKAKTGELTKFDLRNYIYDLPEVELFLKVNNLKTERLRDYAYRPSIYANDVDLSISGTNVLGIVNNIISKSEHHVWMLSHDREGTLYLAF
jgi:hypothetical protein